MAFPARKKLDDSQISQTVLVDWSIIRPDSVDEEMVRMASSSSLNSRNDEFVSFVDELKFQRLVIFDCVMVVGRK